MKSRHDRFWRERARSTLYYRCMTRAIYQNFLVQYPLVIEWHKRITGTTLTSRVIDHKRRHMGFSYPYGKDQTNG